MPLTATNLFGQPSRAIRCWIRVAFCCFALALVESAGLAADPLEWKVKEGKVTADLRATPLQDVLARVAAKTGWEVFVEPSTELQVSAKFTNVTPGEALRLMLSGLNFALVPESSGRSKLYVFRTSRQKATQAVNPLREAGERGAKAIPNELIVRLKPGANIDELARKLGARVVGKIDGLNAYRLRFDDASATEAARGSLASNTDVDSVDNNFSVDRPLDPVGRIAGPNVPPPPQLQLRPPPENGRVIVGLIDTGVQPLGNNLDAFLLKQINVAGQGAPDASLPSHGTSMAETLLRGIAGVSKGSSAVQILPVDVYGPNPSTSTFDVASGIIQAVNGGARIVNLSLGSEADSPFLREVVAEVTRQNIAVFAAAGNQPVTTPYYPAAYQGVYAVTAMDRGQIADYANRGSFVSLAGPGTGIVHFGGQAYFVQGTSAASAFTSGAAAGYMDSTAGGVSQMLGYIRGQFGFNSGASGGAGTAGGRTP